MDKHLFLEATQKVGDAIVKIQFVKYIIIFVGRLACLALYPEGMLGEEVQLQLQVVVRREVKSCSRLSHSSACAGQPLRCFATKLQTSGEEEGLEVGQL